MWGLTSGVLSFLGTWDRSLRSGNGSSPYSEISKNWQNKSPPGAKSSRGRKVDLVQEDRSEKRQEKLGVQARFFFGSRRLLGGALFGTFWSRQLEKPFELSWSFCSKILRQKRTSSGFVRFDEHLRERCLHQRPI